MIAVHEEPGDDPPTERCCFCRRRTRYWCKEKDVACCQECARHAELKDVPSKKVWWRREVIATGGKK